ncbi:hypothetical protein SAMN02983003_1706 [Devosia enhydra]|uniref:Uncharacterized protein n=1 Tax=Devosia enhydra TaxID=665118 RepID=A0A1K2HXC3_9HYPH|nr:hypothetical protein [Devosia enhydra]SFZ83541.1 hypothetical protein SAMN02983003_1706 [Devosia enhydra]
MADYKELLRKAIEALPENNGAARRAVYEKARAALVGQLRAINPPLAARDITTHRLQLEDCIRQVEQEASEAVIAGLGMQEAPPPPPPVFFENKVPQAVKAQQAAKPQPVRGQVVALGRDAAKAPVGREAPRAVPLEAGSIEDIIAAADKDARLDDGRAPAARNGRANGTRNAASARSTQITIEPQDDDEPAPVAAPARNGAGRPLPNIVARAEAARSRGQAGAFVLPAEAAPVETRRGGGRGQLAARQAEAPEYFDDVPVAAAMSSVREVEVEPAPIDPQGAIDRAIATLDREARGDFDDEPTNGVAYDDADDIGVDDRARPAARPAAKGAGKVQAPKAKTGFFAGRSAPAKAAPAAPAKGRVEPQLEKAARVEPEPFDEPEDEATLREPPVQRPAAKPAKPARGKAGRKDFAGKEFSGKDVAAAAQRGKAEPRRGGSAVTVFLLVFLVLLGGAGGAGYWAWQEGYIDLDSMFGAGTADVAQAPAATTPPVGAAAPGNAVTGPGNTATSQTAAAATGELREERLPQAPSVPAPLALVPPSASAAAPGVGVPGTEQRLSATPTETPSQAAAAVAGIDPAATAGSQSLLLEAADAGQTGAIPFSGTVDWTRGTDETGQPTLVGKASIPARNLGVDILIRKNSDPSLPASHLMEINFLVPDTFIGGSIAGLPGVLLKNAELVQGEPLVGASARVVGNTYLFALSASPQDTTNNSALLTSRRWMDLAVIYATGKRAILTLEKDEAAMTLFSDVFGAWTQTASN